MGQLRVEIVGSRRQLAYSPSFGIAVWGRHLPYASAGDIVEDDLLNIAIASHCQVYGSSLGCRIGVATQTSATVILSRGHNGVRAIIAIRAWRGRIPQHPEELLELLCDGAYAHAKAETPHRYIFWHPDMLSMLSDRVRRVAGYHFRSDSHRQILRGCVLCRCRNATLVTWTVLNTWVLLLG